MPTTRKHSKKSKKPSGNSPSGPGNNPVACWEDDPGDPKQHPALTPIQVSAPDQSAAPLPYKLKQKAPAAQVYQPGTAQFLYYANACALRRTADFWGGLVGKGTNWEVGKTLPVDVDSGVDLNAFYTRGDGGDAPGLHFFHESVSGRVYFSGESPDVACHEMGHAVLDAVRPELWDAQTIEAAAFHESFGDMSAMLSGLQVASFRQAVLNETGGNLNHSSRLSRLAEQLGAAIRVQHPDAVDPDCLRNAANSFFYRDPQTLPPSAPASQLSSEPHSFSRVFTAAFLEALAGIFKLQSSADAGGLQKASIDAAQILLGGVAAGAVAPDYYSQVAAGMVQFADGAPFNGKYRDVLKSAFVRRGILSLQSAATLSRVKPHTMRLAANAAVETRSGELPKTTLPAGHYGLNQASLTVHLAAQPRRLAVSGSDFSAGSAETRSSQSAAESYTEDLFQRGHVEVGEHGDKESGLTHPFGYKSHMVREEDGELVLRRISFNCGFQGLTMIGR